MLDFDLSRALFLTYTGLGAAFAALGLLILLILLIRLVEHGRGRRSNPNNSDTVVSEPDLTPADGSPDHQSHDAELVAAIAAAVTLTARANAASAGSSNAEDGIFVAAPVEGWRARGHLETFDYQRVWRRSR